MNGDAMKDGVLRRGSTWSYVVRVRDPATGKKRPLWKGGFRTEQEAKEARDQARVDAKKGTSVLPSRMTVAQYLDAWIEEAASQVRPTTLESYRMHLRVHLKPRIGGERLQELTPTMVQALYGVLQREAGLSASTVRRVAATLRKALNDGVEKGSLPGNPADRRAKLPKVDHDRDGIDELHVWNSAELATFLDHVKGDRLYPMWRLAAWTGMRRGEVCGLTWRDCDLEGGVLRVQRARVIVTKADVRESKPKTRKGRRNVELDVITLAALKAWRKRQEREREAWPGEWPTHDLVFTLEDGSPLYPAHVSRWFNRHVKAAKAPRVRFHDLRHTHASLLLAAGVPVKVVSERLGHHEPGFTMNVYQHLIPGQQRDHLQRVADAAESARPRLRVANA